MSTIMISCSIIMMTVTRVISLRLTGRLARATGKTENFGIQLAGERRVAWARGLPVSGQCDSRRRAGFRPGVRARTPSPGQAGRQIRVIGWTRTHWQLAEDLII